MTHLKLTNAQEAQEKLTFLNLDFKLLVIVIKGLLEFIYVTKVKFTIIILYFGIIIISSFIVI